MGVLRRMHERPSDSDGRISFRINFYKMTADIIGGGMDA